MTAARAPLTLPFPTSPSRDHPPLCSPGEHHSTIPPLPPSQETIFNDFYKMFPEKFQNKTNGERGGGVTLHP